MSDGRRRHSEETRAKIAAAHRGKTHTPETRAKLSALAKTRPPPILDAKARAKISASKRGANNPNYGKKLPAETRARMSAAHQGRKHSEEHRKNMSIARVLRVREQGGRKRSEGTDWRGARVVFASDCERAYFLIRQSEGVHIRAYDPGVDGLFPYQYEGRTHHYVPDFVEERSANLHLIVEVKGFAPEAMSRQPRWVGGGARSLAKMRAYPEVFVVNGQDYKRRARELPTWNPHAD